MIEENNFITGIIGTPQTGKTAFMQEMIIKAEARGKKVAVFKAPLSDTNPSKGSISSDSRTMPPELFKALQNEELSKVGRLKWWEIKAWFKTFKKR